jgi:hypothetical protein
MRVLLLSMTLFVGIRGDAQPPKPKALAGWIDVFPEITGYERTFQAPRVDKKAPAYSQAVRYLWTGGRIEEVEITLARDAAFEKRFAVERLRHAPMPPTPIKMGDFSGWLWKDKQLVLILGKDRALVIESKTPKVFASDFESFAKRFDLKKCAAALDKPPRTDFARTPESFKALRAGMSLSQVRAWVGDAERDIGSGIHILEYALDDGSKVLIGFPDFNRLIYVKHRTTDDKVVDLVK